MSSELSQDAKASVGSALGAMTAPCPPLCNVPADLHRHYVRVPGVFWKLATPFACCGREFARSDELVFLDQCEWCWEDYETLRAEVCSRLVYPMYSKRRS